MSLTLRYKSLFVTEIHDTVTEYRRRVCKLRFTNGITTLPFGFLPVPLVESTYPVLTPAAQRILAGDHLVICLTRHSYKSTGCPRHVGFVEWKGASDKHV